MYLTFRNLDIGMPKRNASSSSSVARALGEQFGVNIDEPERDTETGMGGGGGTGGRGRARAFEENLKKQLEEEGPSEAQINEWVDWADELEENRLRILFPIQLNVYDDLDLDKYAAITSLHQLRHGAHLKWINVDSNAVNGTGFLCDVIAGHEGPVLTLRNMHGVYYSLKLDFEKHLLFQKLTNKELRILQFLNTLLSNIA